METIKGTEQLVLPAPEYAPVKENEQVLLSLGITADHIAALPMIVRTGGIFLLLEVRNTDVLQSLHPLPDHIRLLSDQYRLSGYCLFCRNAGNQADAIARLLPDISQEAAVHITAAAGALACYLYDIAMIKKDEMVIVYDYSTELPASRLAVHLDTRDGKICSLHTAIIEPVQ